MAWLHAVIDVPEDQLVASASFWGRALSWPPGPAWSGHPELRSFEPATGTAYVHLQQVDAPGRVHLDIEVEDVLDAVGSAVALGATQVAAHDRWQTMRSPGSLPFCFVGTSPHALPAPTTWPDGHRSRMVQVCIDSPVAAHDAEVAFWQAMLPGRWEPSAKPEFAGKWHDDESPLQLLFQRLEEEDGSVRAHLDHGTDDRPAEVHRLAELGAQLETSGPGWQVMRDPAGLRFCVTDNSPSTDVPRDLA